MTLIDFDANATTPLDPEVREAMLPFLGPIQGNPSSPHRLGREARARLDEARERVAAVWRCRPAEVVFTSGGTEANNLALLGAARAARSRGRHLIASAIEHHAVLEPLRRLAAHEGFELTLLPVDAEGRVSPDDLRGALRPDTVLVSIMAANNEVGTLEPVAELGVLCRGQGVLFHTDAVQVFGKEPFESICQFEADLVSFCAHKLHGPKGAGALFVRTGVPLEPVLQGGSQELERRPGTENLAAIAGLTLTVERFLAPPVFPGESLRSLTGRLRSALEALPGVRLCVPTAACLANTLSFTIAGAESITVLAALDLEGVCASSGAACSAGALQPSHVLRAMGYDAVQAKGLIRFSLSRGSTLAEVERVSELLPALIARAGPGSKVGT
jgi:cysteine desulfurase